MSSNLKVYIALALANIFWAFSFVWVKIAYEVFNPLSTVILRLTLSSILLFIILGLMGKIERIRRPDYKWFILLAFFEPFLYFLGESFGLQAVSSTVGAVIISTIPLFAPIAGYLFYKERLSPMNFIGLFISFSGVALIVFGKDMTLSAPLYGILLMFLAVFSALGYSSVLKRLSHGYTPFTIISYQNLLGVFFFLPLFLTFDWKHFISTPVTTPSILAILQLTIFASTLAFILFTFGIKRLGVSRANIFANTIPVFTAVFAWYMLDESLTLPKIIGIIVVITGLFVSQFKFKNNGIQLG
jgi:drug/metabolite transporter (DMT)-like permease